MNENYYMTTQEAAEYAGVSRNTILYWIKKGYLGNVNKNVTAGRDCGYKIKKADLSRHVNGWTINDEKPQKQKKVQRDDILTRLKKSEIDKESLLMAANNLKIAIEFAAEELEKINKILNE